MATRLLSFLESGGRRLPRQWRRPSAARGLSTIKVTDDHINELASRPLHPLTLGELVRHGKPPLSPSALYSSANFTLSILPARLANRIQALRSLPFIVVTNPYISKIHNNYVHSLSTLLPWAEKEINTMEDDSNFTDVMADLVHTHQDTISSLARGFLEARKYISAKDVTEFLDEHLRARIGTRLIAEQHIALHLASKPQSDQTKQDIVVPDEHSSYIGVIDTELSPVDMIRHCESVVGDICEFKYGVRPCIAINGELDYTFTHIPVHVEYIITELLKNAFRATIEKRMEREAVEVTIAPLPESPYPKATMGSEECPVESHNDTAASAPIGPMSQSTPGVTIRIRDRGGGISPENYARIWDYSFTTFNEDQINSTLAGDSADASMDALNAISTPGGSSLAGLGYGLPLGRAYAEYFGGGIAVQSLWGWGTDVYLSLRGVGRLDHHK